MGSEEERLQDALLERAQRAIEAAEELVAESDVLAHVSAQLRNGGLTTRCAWCGRYRVGDRWVVIPRSALLDPVRASHGICDDCVESLRGAGLSL